MVRLSVLLAVLVTLSAMVAGARLPPLKRLPAPGRGVSCKAVADAAEARRCDAFEVDLSLTGDGVWVLAHGPDLAGRPVAEMTVEQARERTATLDEFVAALKGRRFKFVDLDIKARGLLPGRSQVTRALERHLPALETLAASSDLLILTSASPARYAELHRFIGKRGLDAKGFQCGLETLDYTPEAADRWGLPLGRSERLLLPLARALSGLYQRLNSAAIPWLVMQESSAAGRTAGRPILCWTRDPASGEPPAACSWTERRTP